jgi:hypothetical protein
VSERDAVSELEQLVNAPATFEVAGVPLDVRPLRIRELPAFIRAAAPLVEAFNAHLVEAEDLLAFVEAGGEHLVAAVALAARISPEFVDALPAGAFLRLVERVLAENADFFVEAAPAIMRLLRTTGAMEAGLARAGLVPSRGSSPPATATKTSSA